MIQGIHIQLQICKNNKIKPYSDHMLEWKMLRMSKELSDHADSQRALVPNFNWQIGESPRSLYRRTITETEKSLI